MEGDILMAENAADTEAGGNVIVTLLLRVPKLISCLGVEVENSSPKR